MSQPDVRLDVPHGTTASATAAAPTAHLEGMRSADIDLMGRAAA